MDKETDFECILWLSTLIFLYFTALFHYNDCVYIIIRDAVVELISSFTIYRGISFN